jgi:tripartite-type tricarboxylate transporter receptor subunit TctC
VHAEVERLRIVDDELRVVHDSYDTKQTKTGTYPVFPHRRKLAMSRTACAALFAAFAMCGAHAQQAAWPTRPVTIVVPYTPATGADVIARLLQPKLAERLGAPVVVENKAGASGAIGTETVAKSAPDGYTFLFTATSHGTIPALKRDLPYDTLKSFVPVALAATSAMALVVGPQVPAATVAEFVALAKKQPGVLYYSSPGNGSIQHLTMELIKQETGIDLVHVPYKGSAGATSDLVGGHVQATVVALQTVAPLVRTGRAKMLAALSEERSPAFPEVPTMRELGHPQLVVDTWYGLFAPAGTPPEIIARLNSEVNALLQLPEVREALARQGMTAVADSPERLGTLVAQELGRWNRVVAAAKIQGD